MGCNQLPPPQDPDGWDANPFELPMPSLAIFGVLLMILFGIGLILWIG